MAPKLKPKAGDLIEIFRVSNQDRDIYQHWAVYVGAGFIVHLTSASDVPGSSANCMSGGGEEALVKKEKLSDVAGNDRWEINNILDEKYEPRPAHVIVKEAEAKVGEAMKYSVISWNCEHFATKMRYGKAESRQVSEGGKRLVNDSLDTAVQKGFVKKAVATVAAVATVSTVAVVAAGGVGAVIAVPAAVVLGIRYLFFGGKKENKNKE